MESVKKDPQAVLDYGFNWINWLGGDTISSSSWLTEAGLTIDSDSNTTATTTVWLSGGVSGNDYIVTNSIVTLAGREDDRSIKIVVLDR